MLSVLILPTTTRVNKTQQRERLQGLAAKDQPTSLKIPSEAS